MLVGIKRIGESILGIRPKVVTDPKIKPEIRENTIKKEIEKIAVRVVEDFIRVNEMDKKNKSEWLRIITDQFYFEQQKLLSDVLPEGVTLKDLKKDLLRLRGVMIHELIVKFTDLYPRSVEELVERMADLDDFWASPEGEKRMEEMGLDAQEIRKDRIGKGWIFGPAEQANLQTVMLSGKVGLTESLPKAIEVLERVKDIFSEIESYFGRDVSLVHPTLAYDQVARSSSPKSGMVFPLSGNPKDKSYDFGRLITDNELRDMNGRPISELRVKNDREVNRKIQDGVSVEVLGKHKLERILDQVTEYREIIGVTFIVELFNNKETFARMGVEKTDVDQMLSNLKNKRDKQKKGGAKEISRSDLYSQLGAIVDVGVRKKVQAEFEKLEREKFEDVDRYLSVVYGKLHEYNEKSKFETSFNYLDFAKDFNSAFLEEFFPGMKMNMVFIDNEEKGDFGYFFKYVKDMNSLMNYMLKKGFLDPNDLVVRISLRDGENSSYRKFSQYRWNSERQIFEVNKNKNRDGSPTPDFVDVTGRTFEELPTGNLKEEITLKEIQDDQNIIAMPLKELEYLMVGSGLLSKVVLLDDGVVYPPLRTLSRAIKMVTSPTGEINDGIPPCYYPYGQVKSRY